MLPSFRAVQLITEMFNATPALHSICFTYQLFIWNVHLYNKLEATHLHAGYFVFKLFVTTEEFAAQLRGISCSEPCMPAYLVL